MKTILVVEDNPLNRELLREVVEVVGFEMLEASNGAEALELLEQNIPDLVLADLQMPLMDGFQLLKEIRSDSRLLGLKVVALTAFAMRGDRERILDAGFDDYITKPLEIGDFQRRLNVLLH